MNGSVGTVKDIIYAGEEGKDTRLPEYIWVDFGDKYTGPTFFPKNAERRGWFPVSPLRATQARFWGERELQNHDAFETILGLDYLEVSRSDYQGESSSQPQ